MSELRYVASRVVLGPLLMVLTFCLLANAGLVTSDPEGRYPLNAREIWSVSK